MKKPFLYAFGAIAYITLIVFVIDKVTSNLPGEAETILIPMTMLGLFVLSAAVMGFLFLSQPLALYLNNQKKEAVSFFATTVGIFAGFVVIFALTLLFIK